MRSFAYIVTDRLGLHARNAALVLRAVESFASDIRLSHWKRPEKSADARDLFSIMSLRIHHGDKIIFTLSGVDEDDAAAALLACIESFL